MTREPVTLVQPQILHQDDQDTVWHAGVVRGPTGRVILNLQIDCAEERRFRGDPAWKAADGRPPIDAFVQITQPRRVVAGSFSFGADRSAFHFECRLEPIGPEELAVADLHIKIHPLDLHFVVNLGAAAVFRQLPGSA